MPIEAKRMSGSPLLSFSLRPSPPLTLALSDQAKERESERSSCSRGGGGGGGSGGGRRREEDEEDERADDKTMWTRVGGMKEGSSKANAGGFTWKRTCRLRLGRKDEEKGEEEEEEE